MPTGLAAGRLVGLVRAAREAAAGDSVLDLGLKSYRIARSRLYLRRCTRVGLFTQVHGRPHIFNQGTLIIGERVLILSNVVPVDLQVFAGAMLEIGDNTFINYGTHIAATGLVRIGRDCKLGMHSIILDNNFHSLEQRRVRPEPRPVVLEDNVWLGHRTIILPGVTIGRDSVVGAGSVVRIDVPPRSIVAGNPARVVKTF